MTATIHSELTAHRLLNVRSLFIGVCLLLLIGGRTSLQAGAAESAPLPAAPAGDVSASSNAAQSPATPPRLFFTPERIARLRTRMETEPPVRVAWEQLRDRANRLLNEKLVALADAESGRGQHGNYGRPSSQIAHLGSTLGLAYRLTGEIRYAAKLKEALLHYAQLQRWAGDAGWDPPWHSELNTARFCFGYAIGLDSIRDALPVEERRAVAAAMVRLGILPTLQDWVLPEQRIHALDSMGHNWWSVCVAMAGVAALAVLDDEPRAAEWVTRVAESFPEWFAYAGNRLHNKSRNFDPKGAFYESVSYANYALSEYLLFRLAYANALPNAPQPVIQLLETAGDFFLHSSYPTSDGLLAVNFGDSSLHAHGARTVGLLLANGFEHPAYPWYLARTDPGLNDPVGLVGYAVQPAAASPPKLPTAFSYPDIGWAMLRSSWEDDATLLAVKSGFTWNHAHPDAGSFILFHAGKPLIIDSGNCSYSRREYTSYYRHSRAHNVVLINGEAQNPEDIARGDRGVAIPGRVEHLLEAAGVKYVLADATGPTAWKFSRNYRHFLWLDGVILVVDDVRAHEPGQLEWLLHYEGDAPSGPDGLRLVNGETCQALVQPLFPENMELVPKKGLKDHDPDTEVEYLAFTPRESLREAKFMMAIIPIPPDATQPKPVLTKWQGDEALGVRIRTADQITDVYLNLRADGRKMHRNSCQVLEGWETDAYLLAITRSADADSKDLEAVERVFMASGSYVRREGRVLVDALSKVFAVFAPGQENLEVAMSGQPLVKLALHTPVRPRRVLVNGVVVQSRYEDQTGLVRFAVSPLTERKP